MANDPRAQRLQTVLTEMSDFRNNLMRGDLLDLDVVEALVALTESISELAAIAADDANM